MKKEKGGSLTSCRHSGRTGQEYVCVFGRRVMCVMGSASVRRACGDPSLKTFILRRVSRGCKVGPKLVCRESNSVPSSHVTVRKEVHSEQSDTGVCVRPGMPNVLRTDIYAVYEGWHRDILRLRPKHCSLKNHIRRALQVLNVQSTVYLNP